MKHIVDPFTTTQGRTVTTKTLLDVIRRIRNGEDYREIINEELSDLPVDEERDVDEAYEVIDYCQDLIDQEELNYLIEHTKHNRS
jgi:hypothetical protein